MTQKEKWLKCFWRWFLAAIDKKDFVKALELAQIIERMKE